MVLIGEVFRSGVGGPTDNPCNTSQASVAGQQEASLSICSHLVAALESSGASVDVLFTFPDSCPATQLRTLASWLGPNVVAHRLVNATRDGRGNACAGWAFGYNLLRQYGEWSGVRHDFVLQARHDIYIDAPLSTWPLAGFSFPQEQPWAQPGPPPERLRPGQLLRQERWQHERMPPPVSWDMMLFEQEGRMCRLAKQGWGCTAGSFPMFDVVGGGLALQLAAHNWRRARAADLGTIFAWPPECELCHRDHLMWTPRRHLPAVSAAVEAGECMHSFLLRLEQRGVRRRDMGFLFPPDCDQPCDKPFADANCGQQSPRRNGTFHTDLMCQDWRAYRPARQAFEA